jgi:xylose dehydrogenase (NAD/NADP)
MTKRLRIGILGAAKIAGSFMVGAKQSSRVEVIAIGSRDRARAEAFAQVHGVARACTYDELLADRDVDAIYNPLPNSLHAAWSIRAVEAGKHVLCEKPIAVTAAEARAMFAAARRHGVTLVEAYPYRAQAQTLKLRELLTSGTIGRLRMMQATIGFMVSDPANIRLSAPLAGGALMDGGCYPVSLVRLVAGERPVRVSASARWAESTVDNTLLATLEHRSGFLAQIACCIASGWHRHALIAGEDGTIETSYLNHPPRSGPPLLLLKRGTKDDAPVERIEVPGGDGFFAEAESFASLVASGPAHWTGVSEEESVDIMLTIEALLRSARSGAPVDVADA